MKVQHDGLTRLTCHTIAHSIIMNQGKDPNYCSINTIIPIYSKDACNFAVRRLARDIPHGTISFWCHFICENTTDVKYECSIVSNERSQCIGRTFSKWSARG